MAWNNNPNSYDRVSERDKMHLELSTHAGYKRGFEGKSLYPVERDWNLSAFYAGWYLGNIYRRQIENHQKAQVLLAMGVEGSA